MLNANDSQIKLEKYHAGCVKFDVKICMEKIGKNVGKNTI